MHMRPRLGPIPWYHACVRRTLPWFIVVLLLAAAFTAAPDVFAQGANQGTTPPSYLVPCTGLDCQACHLATLAQRLIRFLIIIAVPIAALLFAYAGFLYFSSGGSSGNIVKAKGIFLNAFIGFVVALASFLIVEVILNTLVSDKAVRGKWFQIECVNQKSRPGAQTTGGRTPAAASVPPASTQPPAASKSAARTAPSCATCAKITALPVKAGAGTQVDADTNLRLTEMAGKLGGLKEELRVNEGYPPTVTHQNACHYQGTCLDLGFKNQTSYTTQNILQVQNAAKASGLCTVYEPVGSCAGLTGVNCLGSATTKSTGNHFSLYKAGSPSCGGGAASS